MGTGRRNNPYIRHITPHRAWAYLQSNADLEIIPAEHEHILKCEQCLRVFMLWPKSETFGAILKALGTRVADELRSVEVQNEDIAGGLGPILPIRQYMAFEE
jgi:hypothetical protein